MAKTKLKSKKRSTVFRTLHYYLNSTAKYKWYALGAFLTTPVIVFVRAILAPLIFADLIDKVSQGMSATELITTAAWEIGVFLVLYAIEKLVLDQLRLYCGWKLEILVIYDLAGRCFTTICEQSLQFHNNHFSGSLVSQTNKFIYAYGHLFDTLIWDLFPMIIYIIMMVVVLLPQAPWFTLGVIGFVLAYALVSGLSFHKTSTLTDKRSEAESKQSGQLADSISNITSVKSYARELYEQHRYANFARRSYDCDRYLMRATIIRDIKFGFIQIGMTALILLFLVNGREWLGISVATLILIVNYTQTIMGELWNINNIYKNINRVFGDAHEMTLILDMVDDVVDAPDAKPLLFEAAKVDFNHISFQHGDAKEPIFTDFDLHIKPGERVGLVGVSGSGKTTLTKLLLRFADVKEGTVTVSDQDIKTVTQQTLREHIAYVPQETSLFHRSIADNIAYGKPGASLDEIKRAAELANASEFIEKLPQGYNTLVGERGIKLSGGQRQRIAIARAILKDAPILVLDEATSALDSESEALIQDALSKLMAGRTSIVIAHRLSTVASLDRIVVLEDGKIIEQGPHRTLLANPQGVYHKLWSRQSGAFMEDD